MMNQAPLSSTMAPLAKRLESVSDSATLKLNATVQSMKRQGIDVVNLTAGEPDFNAPEVAKQAILDAVRDNQSKYTPAAGILELREAVSHKTNLQQPLLAKDRPWTASNVVITNGAKQALFNSFMAILDPGDEVLIPSPYWLSYPDMVKISGGIPKFISAPFSQGFKIRPEQVKAALGPKVKALILNSPSNPTGALYSGADYAAIAEVLRKTPGADKVWILSDEIYDRIILGNSEFCSFLNAAPDLRDRTITINGMSKSAAMTGWRVGWSVGSDLVSQAMTVLQGQSTSGINSLAQRASIAALKLPEAYFEPQVQIYQKRRDLMLQGLSEVSRLEVISPQGAFYVFVGVGAYLRMGEDSLLFSQKLLEEARVAVVPGAIFGEPQFLRLSFATDEQSIREGCCRFVDYLKKLS